MKKLSNILMILLLIACQPEKTQDINELFDIDKKFSDSAVEKGFKIAFVEFAHDDAVLLRENSMPVVGKSSISKLFENASAEGIDFTWEPLAGEIAKSGELGFTYGIFTLKADTLIEKGTYVSIWKKDKDGNWKYILDSGNKGLGE